MLTNGGAFVLAKEDIGTTGPSLETHLGPEPGSVCLTQSDGQPWGRTRSLEEPDASIALVRICGGRRPAYGPGGPIPEAAIGNDGSGENFFEIHGQFDRQPKSTP